MKKEELKCRKCGKYKPRNTFPISTNGIRSKIGECCRVREIYAHSKEVCRVSSYEHKVMQRITDEQALKVAKEQHTEKIKSGNYKYVPSGIRSYVLKRV